SHQLLIITTISLFFFTHRYLLSTYPLPGNSPPTLQLEDIYLPICVAVLLIQMAFPLINGGAISAKQASLKQASQHLCITANRHHSISLSNINVSHPFVLIMRHTLPM